MTIFGLAVGPDHGAAASSPHLFAGEADRAVAGLGLARRRTAEVRAGAAAAAAGLVLRNVGARAGLS